MQTPNGTRWAAAIVLIGLAGAPCGDVLAGSPFQGQVLNYQSKVLYDAPPDPNNPGVLPYTAWTGIWKLPNGTIQTDFVKATGPTSNPVITNPVFQSTDNGKTWTGPGYVPTGYSHGMAVLPGDTPSGMTMVRPTTVYVFGPSGPYPSGILQRNHPFDGVERSTDGGQTWSQVNLVSSEDYPGCWPTVVKPLSDGRLVAFAGLATVPPTPQQGSAGIVKTMFVSSDGGQHWGPPITVMPASTGVCEESDFVELPGGNLMFISRAQHYDANGNFQYENRLQTMVRKSGNTFLPDTTSTVPFGGGGFPCDLMTKEGIILDLEGGYGANWSSDNGTTWHSLLVNGQPLNTYYYPQAVQADDGTIVVVSHNGTDAVYGTIDEPIMVQTFRLSAVHAPEPSALTLLGIAVLSLLAYVWQRRKPVTGLSH
jgi:hypothetical protein